MSNAHDESARVPARMLNEFVYCPRLFYLEHVLGEFSDNVDTVEGRYRHRRVDVESGSPTAASEAEAGSLGDVPNDGWTISTSVWLDAPSIGSTCRIDRLETRGGVAVPVDYKRGKRPDVSDGPYDPERVQVCVQGLILRENGYRSEHGFIWYAESRDRVRIDFTEELVARTRESLKDAADLARNGTIPPPLIDSPKCPRCSLVGICLPDETTLVGRNSNRSQAKPRRLVTERPDAGPVYVQEQGHFVAKAGDTAEIRRKREVVSRVRLLDVSQLVVYGNVQVSTALVRELISRGASISYMTYGGWFVGMARGEDHKNVQRRIAQHRFCDEPLRSLGLAREFVRGKILNCRTLLRRNRTLDADDALDELKRLAARVDRVDDMSSLLGIEGLAARAYFRTFPVMLKTTYGAFDFRARNRRPPRDPVNALLSFAYSLLTRELTTITSAVGFDPYRGVYHQSKYGKPALALDLMEEFRPLIADSIVIQALNNGEVQTSDFIHRAGSCALTSRARRKFIETYERRMRTSIKHPVFGYSASYRRIVEIQARLVGRFLEGEIDQYPAFRTR